jgi:hypothetical protein
MKVLRIRRQVLELQRKLDALRDDCIQLLSHPEATHEQIMQAKAVLVDTQKRITEVNAKLTRRIVPKLTLVKG